jgi:hypothetical protein
MSTEITQFEERPADRAGERTGPLDVSKSTRRAHNE